VQCPATLVVTGEGGAVCPAVCSLAPNRDLETVGELASKYKNVKTDGADRYQDNILFPLPSLGCASPQTQDEKLSS
jgi:hypothetical protein